MFPILQVADYNQDENKSGQIIICLIIDSHFVLFDTEVPVCIVCSAAPESSAIAANATNGEHHRRIRTQRC